MDVRFSKGGETPDSSLLLMAKNLNVGMPSYLSSNSFVYNCQTNNILIFLQAHKFFQILMLIWGNYFPWRPVQIPPELPPFWRTWCEWRENSDSPEMWSSIPQHWLETNLATCQAQRPRAWAVNLSPQTYVGDTALKSKAGENTPQNLQVPHLSTMSPHRNKIPRDSRTCSF